MNYGLRLIIMINIGSLTKASVSDIKRRNCAQGGWNYVGTLKYLLNYFFSTNLILFLQKQSIVKKKKSSIEPGTNYNELCHLLADILNISIHT